MFKTISSAILALLVAASLLLGFFLLRTQAQQRQITNRLTLIEQNLSLRSTSFPPSSTASPTLPSAPVSSASQTSSDLSSELADLRSYVDQSLATLSATPTQTTPTTTIITPSPTKQTSFITIDTTASTTSTSWVDVPGSGVYIDLVNDYSADAYITWSVSLKVAHGNGQAFARLYDDTNDIAVAGSELSTINNIDYEQKTSANLPLWRGNNLYKLQLKSLNSFEITATSAKLKITY